MADWHVFKDNQSWGPYSAEEVAHYVTTGHLDGTAMVWAPGYPAWTPIGQVFAVPEPVPAYVPPRRVSVRRKGFFAGWMDAAGGRSFTLQMICLGWTVLIGGLALTSSIRIAGATPSRYSEAYYDPDLEARVKAASLAGSWTCMAGAWALVVLPCGIAAIATYGPRRQK